MLCSLSYEVYCIGDKIAPYRFKDEITRLLKANYGLKFDEDVALNHIREKVKPRCKIPYKVLKEEDTYVQFIAIYKYPTLIQLKYYLERIHHCVTAVGK